MPAVQRTEWVIAVAVMAACLTPCMPACSSSRPVPAVESPAPAMGSEPSSARLMARELAGRWRWSMVTDEGGVRRIEVERWQLRARGKDAIEGGYERVVTFLAGSGVPFTCNQALGYELRTVYRVEGVVRNGRLELRETDYLTAPSPCDSGHRGLASYGGERVGERLVLRWSGGEQTLVPDDAEPAAAEQAATERAEESLRLPAGRAEVTGRWRWQTRSQDGSQIRVEVEDWDLAEISAGVIEGTVERSVTIFDAGGQRYDCSGDTFYRYRDRYTVRGHRTGTRVGLHETAVEPERHPCLVHEDRHLDAAVGELSGDYLVLTWRGARRQVLHPAD